MNLKLPEGICVLDYLFKVPKKYHKMSSFEILSRATTQMNLEDITLSEISQLQKDKYYDSTFMRSIKQSHSQRETLEWQFPEAGGGEMNCSVGTEFQF